MSDTRTNAYADAVFGYPGAEGANAEMEDELFRLGRLEGNEELRRTLADPHLPAATRQQVVEDLLAGKATTPPSPSSR